MDAPSPVRHHRLAWLALGTLGILLLLPSTRYLLRMQLQTATLTTPTANLAAARAAAQLSDDYPVQLALATDTPHSFTNPASSIPSVTNLTSTRRAVTNPGPATRNPDSIRFLNKNPPCEQGGFLLRAENYLFVPT